MPELASEEEHRVQARPARRRRRAAAARARRALPARGADAPRALRCAQSLEDKSAEAQTRVQVPPPLVLSGHAASLTPY